jgi:broad specificity phosphatase PhoE
MVHGSLSHVGTLMVVRHGQASLFAADYDELSTLGEAQARALGSWLRTQGPPPDRVMTGPAKRQRETARICGEAYQGGEAYRGGEADGERAWPEPELAPELDEHDAFRMLASVVPRLQHDPEIATLAAAAAERGDARVRSASFQRLFEAVMHRWLRGELDDDTLESWPEFAARVERGLQRIVEPRGAGQNIVAFTSVGPIAVLLRAALGTDDNASFRTAWRIRNASISTFVFRGRELTLDGFNSLPHLPERSAWTFR